MKETICTVAGLVGGFIATLLPTSYPMSAYRSPSNSKHCISDQPRSQAHWLPAYPASGSGIGTNYIRDTVCICSA